MTPERLRERLGQIFGELKSIENHLSENVTRELIAYIPVVYELVEATDAVRRAKKLVEENLRRMS